MQINRAILLVLLLLAIAAGVTLKIYCFREAEPIYGGKPLHVWLEAYDPYLQWNTSPAQKNEADTAIRNAGTNALPILLRMLRANDKPWSDKLHALLNKQHIIEIKHTQAANLNFAAAQAF